MKWKDRYGIAYGKGLKKVGNVEAHLSYKKLHRTGRLLRGLRKKVEARGRGKDIVLFNNVPYAKDHNEGGQTGGHKVVKAPFVTNGAKAVITGGNVVARPFMRPSKKILRLPSTLFNKKMRSFGWKSS